ncbi:hypothetical protein [Agaribacterium haliotis]|uniref:hypothetical protein n=1 Tax=Agaribacterium haliotis TaxID=2013869 RepID=UPI000BB56239|nr:hypothetical protein [Agaribacterium haliotis]
MHELNIGDFCKDAARIILSLYQRFPQKSTLYIEDISGPDNPDDFGLHSSRHMACFSTVVWLAEEGWLRYGDNIQQEAFDEVVLSQKAFVYFAGVDTLDNASNSTPDGTGTQTRIHKLEQILKNKSSDQLCAYIIEQMQAFLP